MEKGKKVKEIAIDKAGDVRDLAIAVKNNIEDGSGKAAELARKTKNTIDEKFLSPFTKGEFEQEDFKLSPIIRLLDSNPHADKPVCVDAIGYRTIIAKNSVLDLVKPEIPEGKLKFYPNLSDPLYYRNPYISNFYVSLNDYFDFIKRERTNELVNVANKLGATYVKVTLKEEKKTFVNVKGAKKEKVKSKEKNNLVNAEDSTSISAHMSDLKELEVVSEMEFQGHKDPEQPELIYYKNDSDIESLISMCLEGKNPPKSKSYMLKYNRSTDISLDAAKKIDAVLAKLSMTASASFTSEVEKEKRLYMEYEIKF